jgi:hypothetical protein
MYQLHYEDVKWEPFNAPLILHRLPRTLLASGFRKQEEFQENLGSVAEWTIDEP